MKVIFKQLLLATAMLFASTMVFAQSNDFGKNVISKGYHGFVDLGYSVGVGDFDDLGHVNVSTSHGYQINHYIFVGGGVGVNYYHDGDAVVVPVFTHIRSVFMKNWISPFVDIKGGYSFADLEGTYFNPSVGCRIALNNKLGIGLAVGYEFQFIDNEYISDDEYIGGVSIKASFDF